jgi:membrane protease YdiL (CAAX protease family)
MMESADIQTQLQEKWLIFWWALGIGMLTLGIARRQGLLKPFCASYLPLIRGINVLKGFGFFIFMEVFFVPACITLVFALIAENSEHMMFVNQNTKGWFNLLIIIGGFGGVFVAYVGLTAEQRQQLWQQTSDPWYHNVGIGIASWFVCYPFVVAFSQVVSIAIWHFSYQFFNEQIAVTHLRSTLSNPLLFAATASAVVILVPITEEFLFRGLLQNWLKRKFHYAPAAVIISSLVFALFHYSSSQGVTNIELLSSLFLLSCVIGFIYERQRSLWAPIGLHSFFNLMSLLMIFKEP